MSLQGENVQQLPSRSEFLERCMLRCTAPPEMICTICTDICNIEEDVIKISHGSYCFFHKECLFGWFASSNPLRSTCPNDRIPLFSADPLTQEQLDNQSELNQYYLEDIRLTMETIEISRSHIEDLYEGLWNDICPHFIVHDWENLLGTRRALQANLDYYLIVLGLADVQEWHRQEMRNVVREIEVALENGEVAFEAAAEEDFTEKLAEILPKIKNIRSRSPSSLSVVENFEKAAVNLEELATTATAHSWRELLDDTTELLRQIDDYTRKKSRLQWNQSLE